MTAHGHDLSSDRYRRDKRRRSPSPSFSRRPRSINASDDNGRTACLERWTGTLESFEDVQFDLQFEWQQQQSLFSRMLFGRGGPLNDDKNTVQDFWTFTSRLVAKILTQAEREGINGPTYMLKAPLLKFHTVPKSFNIVQRYRYVKSDDDRYADIPDGILKSLYYVVVVYLDFLEKQEFSKLKELRQNQADLPIANYRRKLLDLLRDNTLVIVSGDTGCGKSTQVPQYLLKAGYTNVCCTQPRRIACISLSKRVAYETLNEYGSEIAYQIRFEKTRTSRTKVVFMTEGLLLRQMGGDPLLSQYNVLVLDEVHERHLHSDFLLGVVRCLVEQRSDLKIVLMSATINIQLFANYFDGAPVLQVPGRLYPIQVHYTPISAESRSSARLNPGPYVRVLQMIDQKYPPKERGDVLIFLSGINEITSLVDAATEYAQKTRKWIILALHSSLSLKEQDKVFDIAPEGVRKCVVATNIAETSITIDGIRFVVDSGKVKEMSYDAKYHMQRLQEFWISQASAEQRRGRAGRTGPGVCYRMYQQSDYDTFNQYSTPEIQRVPLDSLILQMISMGLTEVRKFPFIEPPAAMTIEHSVASLKSHDALNELEELTLIGKTLAQLPLDVMVGKILISGIVLYNFLEPILFTTAGLTIQSPFTNRAFRDLESRSLLEKHFSTHGDSLTLLQVFHAWLDEKLRGHDGSDGSRRWCRKRGVEEQRLYEITKLSGQFRDILQDHKLLNTKKIMEEIQTDRVQRIGQVKQLRFLRRTAQRNKRGRKMLNLDEDTIASDEEKAGDEVDIQDVEFQLKNERSSIEDMFDASGNLSEVELRILKLILCSGLYPNYAIADDCNSYKSDQDQIFHTRSKPFVVLHPTSVFAFQPEVLVTSAVQAESPTIRRGAYSEQHQLLFYVSLLETNKPYMVNCLRIPALHSLLLFAHSIDTNLDCSRLVFDGWVDISISAASDAQNVLELAVWIRQLWKRLLYLRLKESQTSSTEFGSKSAGLSRVIEMDLVAKLTDFVSTPVMCSVTRLLAADMKVLYLGGPGSRKRIDAPDLPQSEFKGGTRITEYLTYNCIVDTIVCSEECEWQCQKCGEVFAMTVFDRLEHWKSCTADEKEYDVFPEIATEQLPNNPLAREWFCDECAKTLLLTPADILKHSRSHRK